MSETIDHTRCSELLGPYVRAELAAAEARRVEAHLEDCDECSSEHRALLALQSSETTAPLTEIERARLRRVVLEQAVPVPDPATEPVPAAQRGARLFPWLGAAALIVLIAIFAYGGIGGMGGSEEGASSDAPGVSDAEGDGEDAQDDTLQAGDGATDEAARSDAAGTAAGPVAESFRAAPVPTFRPSMGEVDRTRLNRLGRRALPLVVFSRAYSVQDVEKHRDDFVEQIAEQAPAARARQIRECVDTIVANFPTALPAYSGIGEFVDRPQREVLVVAFAWSDDSQGPLDQSMVWAWPLGTCDAVAHYSKNVIEPRR